MNKTKVSIIAVVVALVAAFLYWLARPRVSSLPVSALTTLTPLTERQAAKIYVAHDTLMTETHEGPQIRYVPPEGHTSLTVNKDGTLDEDFDSHGLTFEPGVGLVYADQLRLGLDVEFYFWNRLGLNLGVGISNKAPVARPFLALTYQLDQIHLDNTSLLVGVSTGKEIVVGVRVAF